MNHIPLIRLADPSIHTWDLILLISGWGLLNGSKKVVRKKIYVPRKLGDRVTWLIDNLGELVFVDI
jgi:hypothetical protein